MNGLPVGWRRRLTDGFVLRKADAVVALSNAEREFLTRRRGLPPERIAVIPNGISTAVFDRIPDAGRAHQRPAVRRPTPGVQRPGLFVARLARRARLPIRASNCGSSTRPARCSTDTGSTRPGSGWTDCLEFAGSRTAAGLAQLYSTAAVVVSPSLGECLSTVVLEAMCCGAAVVATDVGGIREQLDEDTGVIVPPRDSAALARAICALLADGDRRRRLGQAAWRKAHAQFSVRQMIDRHVRLYEELLETHERAA